MTYYSGPYAQGQLLKTLDEIETALTQDFLTSGPTTVSFEQKSWRDRVIDSSFGRNTVIFDDQGNPSVMVIVHHNRESLIGNPEIETHPAFMVQGQLRPTIYVSKYLNMVAGTGEGARPLSLKGVDPRGYYSYAGTVNICRSKGAGWHLLTNAEWSAIALGCWNRGFFPRGNTDRGKSHEVPSETGVPSFYYQGRPGRVLTGSGPISWSHDGTPYGIYDLHGQMRDRVAGLKFVDRTIQVIPDNDAAISDADLSPESLLWKVILEDGSFEPPGTPGALGFVTVSSVIKVQRDVAPWSGTLERAFVDTEVSEGVTVPDVLKQLTIFPKDQNPPSSEAGSIRLNGTGTTTVYRGGSWGQPGFMHLDASSKFTRTEQWIGFRSSFIEGV